jgi:CBS domain containing-hemolysin-like protein
MLVLLLAIPVLCFLALEAFFSGSETAIISANKMRLKALADRGDSRAKLASRLLKRPERLLGTTLVGTNIAVVTGTTLAAVVAASLLRSSYGVGRTDLESTITTLIMTPLILIFGEIIPKSVCRARANSIALTISPLLRWASVVLYPIVTFVTKIASSFALVLSRRSVGKKPSTVMEELRLLARLSEKEGLLRPQQRKMIYSIFDLERQTVASTMVPLVDVVSIEKNTSLEEFYDKVTETRFSRFPVYEGRIDNIVGIVNVLDVLYSIDRTADVSPFVHEDIIYFPESKHITTSLHELQNGRYPMAIVVDEYGGVVGLVTIEDLVEEIVGEIRDERDPTKDGFKPDESGNYECDGRMEIDEINDRLGTDIPKDGYETIAGFVISQMDRIPKAGEETEWGNLRIVVLQADERSVLKVKFVIEERMENEEVETGDTEG